MKRFSILLLWSILLAGCRMEDINQNPNRPTEVPLNTLLPSAQRNLSNTVGREVWQYSNLLSNQMLGIQLQPQQISQYVVDEVFVGFMYSDFYIGVMHNLDIIIRRAEANGSPHYAGVARVLMAYSLSILTTFWGDVPFSEALNRENIHPRFDRQEDIYSTLDQMLSRAIEDLQTNQSNFSPSTDDLFYGGNRTLWIKAANALRARLALHTIKRNPNATSAALNYLSNTFSSPQEALVYKYQGTQTDPNPIYIYFLTNPNMVVHPDFRRLLTDLDDPRKGKLLYRKPFTADTIPGLVLSDIGAPFALIPFEEIHFMKAEIFVRQGQTALAQAELSSAIHENFRRIMGEDYNSDTADAYIAQNATLSGDLSSDLNKVMVQKHIALFTHHEPYTDYRRTGFPALIPHPNGANPQNPNGQIPRRLIYPQIERLNNKNFPQPAPDMQTRFWWDE
ncbi:MAG: SusD/RagB family nutrient-binding outer membrane lipoprotein [Thermaurantimonas sp.]